MHKILLIEDSKEIYRMVDNILTQPLVTISWAQTLKDASAEISEQDFDLILLDIELPDGNGLEFCTQAQAKSPETPIFIITSHSDLSEKVMGFSAGADDYITKPFNAMELKARVDARLKKISLLKTVSDNLKWKEIEINKSSQEVFISHEGIQKKLDLTSLEFKLLMYFANNPNQVIERDTLLNNIWGADVHVYSRSVDTHVSKLRKKLEEVSHIIESVHGAGYKFNPNQ